MKTASACDIAINMMQDAVLESPVINIDETTVQVLKEPGRIKSYMWVAGPCPPKIQRGHQSSREQKESFRQCRDCS